MTKDKPVEDRAEPQQVAARDQAPSPAEGTRVIQIRLSDKEFERLDALSKQGVMPRSMVARLAVLAGLDFVQGRIAATPPPEPVPVQVIDATVIRIDAGDCHHFGVGHSQAYQNALGTMHDVALGLAGLISRRYDLPLKDAYYTMVVAMRDLFLTVAIIGDNMQRVSFDAFVAKLVQAAEDRWLQAHKESVCTTSEPADKAGLS